MPEDVGKRIKHFRQQKKITQTELGNHTNKDRQYIYKIEKGMVTPNIVTISVLLKAMDISLKEFFSEGFD